MLTETTSWLGIDWTAVGAIATVVLALFTATLALATYRLAQETRRLSGTTNEELDLLRQQTKAQQEQTGLLHAEREDASRPALFWEHDGAQAQLGQGGRPERSIAMKITNRGAPAYVARVRIIPTSLGVAEPLERELSALIDSGQSRHVPIRVWGFDQGNDEHVVRVTAEAGYYTPNSRRVDVGVDVVVTTDGGFHLRPI